MIRTILKDLGINSEKVNVDWSPAKLTEYAVKAGEGVLTNTGSLMCKTGKYTGRSPQNRYIVDAPKAHENVNWNSPQNRPIDVETYERLYSNVAAYLSDREVFVVRAFAGADRAYARKVLVVCERASQALFISQLLVRPTKDELSNFGRPDITVFAAPGYSTSKEVDGVDGDAAVMLNFDTKGIIVAGTGYSGEIKKGVFTTMSYLLPVEDGVLSMHCSANVDPATGKTAVLFGLSGTGKTTLSADPNRRLIGDDEHGWSPRGIFNIEGGCYAKCINLSAENEPDIYNAIRFGSLVENVVMDPVTREFDFDDASLTENTRVGYPVNYISNAAIPGVGGVPKVVIFLTADAFGVLPPISKLSPDAAMYHFVTGFTSKLAGTERGITEPKPTFSTLFGEPFMPMDPAVYANMLGEKIAKYGTAVYLVNTGWAGGSAQELGKEGRMKLRYTRAMVTAALNGELANAEYEHSEIFNVEMPKAVTGCPSEILNPETLWIANGKTKEDYVAAANNLANMFSENFAKKYPDMPKNIAEAGPKAK